MSGFFARHKALWISVSSVVVGLFILWMTKAILLSLALSLKTGINISIEDWSISWRSTTFKNFQVRTPSDPVYPTALRIGSIEVHAGLFDLMRKTSRIDRVAINDVFMGINLRSDGSSNWSAPLKRLSMHGDSSSKDEGSSYFTINQFELNGATVGLTKPGKGEKRYGPTNISAKNLGSDRPMSLGGLVEFIVKEVTSNIIQKYALPNLLEGIVKAPGKILFSPFKAIKKLFSMEASQIPSIDEKS